MFALILMVSLGAHACATQPRDCPQPAIRCAGLVTEFGSVEQGTSHQAWLALLDARSAGLLHRVDFIETIDARDRQANIEALAEQGYDIIVTVGAGIADETTYAARRYPAVRFIGVRQPLDLELSNLTLLTFREEESGFLAGAAAGTMSRTGHVAAVCEADFIDWIRRYCEGYRAGVEFVDPQIRVTVHYRTGSQGLLFRDVQWGRQTALLALNAGADVLFAVGDETAAAALKAAAQQGIPVIGAETDQYLDMPEIRRQLITSAILDVRSGVISLLEDAVDGQLQAGEHLGEADLAPFHEFERWAAPEIAARLREIVGDVEAGAVPINIAP